MADLKKIKALALDVDGVLTDGGVYAIDGDLIRKFNAKDCFAIRMATLHNYPVAIITGGISQTIAQRLSRCGVLGENVFIGSRAKLKDLDKFCEKYNLTYSDILYCGDDVPDKPVLEVVGVGACPADAMDEVKAVASYVSEKKGGDGFVREIVEKMLREKGDWNFDVDAYEAKF